MKSITTYITEAFGEIVLSDVEVHYTVSPNVVTFTAPDTYSESDIQTYIGDRFLNELPGGTNSKKFFGKNASNIYDAYFEYSKFERTANLPETVNFAWDEKYDEAKTNAKLNLFTLHDMEYIIKFDSFTLKKNTGDDIRKVIDKIFEVTGDNKYNDYSIVITYEPDKLEFKEQ